MSQVISIFKNEKILYEHMVLTSSDNRHFDFHVHDICEIIFLKSGNVSAIIENKMYKLQKNSLIIFRANTPHRIIVNDSSDYERYDILFDENILANSIFHRLGHNLTVINCAGNDSIADLFKKFDFYCDNFRDKDLEILITNVIEELIFNLYLSANDFEGDSISVHPVIGKAIKYANEHYSEDITIDTMADYLCITKSHLHHLFVEYMKITPKKYITIRRLAKAQKLIKSGKKPSTVFSSCGFGDYATFFRNYTNHFGYKPSEENKIIKERKINS